MKPLRAGIIVGTGRLKRLRRRTGFASSQRRGNPAFLASQTGLPSYPEAPPEWRKCARHREWLDFCIRQGACIAPIVLGGAWHGWRADQGDGWGAAPMIAPYADGDWAPIGCTHHAACTTGSSSTNVWRRHVSPASSAWLENLPGGGEQAPAEAEIPAKNAT